MRSKEPRRQLRIGITGGIGSGKTLACKYFEKLGYKVIYADIIAKRLYTQDVKKKLVKEFGDAILDEKGNVSALNFREIIFSSGKNIKRVNKIVHPFVIKEIEKIISKINNRIVLIETAIMFESGYYKTVDYCILIYTDKSIRIERVRKRDGMPVSHIKNLMKLQMDEKKKIEMADFVIRNNSTVKNFKKSLKQFSGVLKVL